MCIRDRSIQRRMRVNGKTIKVRVWDTAGQEQYRAIAKEFYKKVEGIMLVYDVTARTGGEGMDTHDRIKIWMNEINENADHDVVKYLVANKIDEEEKRVIEKDEGMNWAQEFDVEYAEASAKRNTNIREIFETVIVKACKVLKEKPGKSAFKIASKKPKKGKCC
eukprot:TRINITY_DN8653_c0_g1_i3.p2 TRINITY_DN8653_c0_g1~~TRINITY_DN8653_c0_g1_i3.p2  ORF type:complete len:164 (-),score=44.31 TRINITY_DN8653_c0_g1_i3:44-535(-)